MKKTESTSLEDKTTMTEKSNQSEEYSLNEPNQETGPEKTQEVPNDVHSFISREIGKKGEEAEILASEIMQDMKKEIDMDEILRNNDKFETVNVIMKLLCQELGISAESDIRTLVGALNSVKEAYYKSMEDWKNLTKQGQKQSIRQ